MNISKLKTRETIFLFIFLYSLFINTSLSAQTIRDITALPSCNRDRVEENMTAQLVVYPQEKIHLHTDRDFCPENILFDLL